MTPPTSYREIRLTQGNVAIVDADVFDRISWFNWRAYQDGLTYYADSHIYRLNGKRVSVMMHRCILGKAADGFQVDHINGDGLDNRLENLRLVNNQQNGANRRNRNKHGLKGVFLDRGRWRATIQFKEKRIALGTFKTKEDAHAAYCVAATNLFGEFARLK